MIETDCLHGWIVSGAVQAAPGTVFVVQDCMLLVTLMCYTQPVQNHLHQQRPQIAQAWNL